MEYQELSHNDSKLIYIWAKPEVVEKIDKLASFCRMTRGQLLEQIVDGIDPELFQRVTA